MTRSRLASLPLIALAFLATGARGGGCGAVNSTSPAPDVTGRWSVDYDDQLGVEITIGGEVYTTELGAQGGSFTIDHEGQPITFDLDCDRPEIVCPTEAWPTEVTIEQRNTELQHQMIVNLPNQSCSGATVDPDPSECGEGTLNPDCAPVCDGEITVTNRETFGVIDESGSSFDLLLGAGVATNGINCALLGLSIAGADIVSTGSSEQGNWEAQSMENGEVIVGYAGGCLWAGDPDGDGDLEALVLAAGVKFTTGFTADRL